MKVTTVCIAGLPCDVHDARMKHDGFCFDQRYKQEDNGILINRKLTGQDLVETVFHEVLHRADPDKTETWVANVAAVAAEILFTPPFEDRL